MLNIYCLPESNNLLRKTDQCEGCYIPHFIFWSNLVIFFNRLAGQKKPLYNLIWPTFYFRTERKCEMKPESVCRDEARTISVQIPLNNCEVVTPASVLAEDSVTPVLNDEPEIGERAEDDELEYPDY